MLHDHWLIANDFEGVYDLYGHLWLGSGFRCRSTSRGWIAQRNNHASSAHDSPECALRSLGWTPSRQTQSLVPDGQNVSTYAP